MGQLVGLGENALSSDTVQCSPPTAWTDEENGVVGRWEYQSSHGFMAALLKNLHVNIQNPFSVQP